MSEINKSEQPEELTEPESAEPFVDYYDELGIVKTDKLKPKHIEEAYNQQADTQANRFKEGVITDVEYNEKMDSLDQALVALINDQARKEYDVKYNEYKESKSKPEPKNEVAESPVESLPDTEAGGLEVKNNSLSEGAEPETTPREILKKSNQEISDLKKSLSEVEKLRLIQYESGDITEDRLNDKTKEVGKKIREIEEEARGKIKRNSKQLLKSSETTESLPNTESGDSITKKAVEKNDAKAEKMKRPEGVSLSARLNEIKDNKELRDHLEAQLKGEKVYHFKKGVKQYLTVNDIREEDGKWIADLIYYEPDGSEKIRKGYPVDKIKFKHWKKEAPKEVDEPAFIREEDGSYRSGSAKELNQEKLIKYEYDGGVAYAEQSDPRPPAPEGAEAPKPETSASRSVDLDMESWTDEEKELFNRVIELRRKIEGDDFGKGEDDDQNPVKEKPKKSDIFEAEDFEIPPSEDEEEIVEPASAQGSGVAKEKPKLGFWGKLSGSLGLWKFNQYIKEQAEKIEELDKYIEMYEGKPSICTKCGREYELNISNPSCPYCGNITKFLKKLKKRKRQLEREGRFSSKPEVEDLLDEQIVSDEVEGSPEEKPHERIENAQSFGELEQILRDQKGNREFLTDEYDEHALKDDIINIRAIRYEIEAEKDGVEDERGKEVIDEAVKLIVKNGKIKKSQLKRLLKIRK